MRYRADIDGLRAIAVLAVVLYHAGFSWLPGGFVGVDVFFVISGYLMGRILLDKDSRRQGLMAFYARRARRIFPALIVVSLVSAVLAAAMFLPAAFRDFGQSAVATAFFLSNLLFWSEAGYFDAAAQTKPLLHGWSLAVEEQYYLVLPPVLWLCLRLFGNRWAMALLPVALASLMLAEWQTRYAPDAAFFLLPARLWELLLGTLLAWDRLPRARAHALSELLAGGGLAAILWAAAGYSASTPFPGAAALLPCLGAAAVIHSGRDVATAAGRMLALRPMVAIGLISYSLYLWHWPVLVFAEYAAVRELTGAESLLAVAAAVLLAAASWRFVEQPFRRRTALPPFRIVAAGAAAMLVLAVIGMTAHARGGWPARFTPLVLATADGAGLVHDRRDCHFASRKPGPDALCRRGDPDGRLRFLLLGDSHADMFSPALFAAAGDLGLAGLQLTDSGYVPAPGVFRAGMRDRDGANHALLDSVLAAHPEIRLVVVGQYWRQSRDYTLFSAARAAYLPRPISLPAALGRLAGRYPARQFHFLLDTPVSARFGPKAAARSLYLNPAPAPLPLDAFRRQLDAGAVVAERLRAYPNVTFGTVSGPLCTEDGCQAARNGELLYRDIDHLSHRGALRLTPAFRALLTGYFPPGTAVQDVRTGRPEG